MATNTAATTIGISSWMMSEAMKSSLAPESCRWCDRDVQGRDEVNWLDRTARSSLRWNRPSVARATSDALAFGAATVGATLFAALASKGEGHERFWTDLMVISETAAFAMNVNQAAKFAMGRERPFVHAGADGLARTSDDNLSFFSGHTTYAFVLAATTGSIASMRHSRYAPEIWAGGMALASLTAYLRVAGDQHYLSDVLVGAGLGTAVGVGLPRLLYAMLDDAENPRRVVSCLPFATYNLVSVGCTF